MNQPPTADNFEYRNEWTYSLIDCCGDCKGLCYALFCLPCYVGGAFSKANECCCTPILCPHTLGAFRSKLRGHFKIDGSLWKDWFILYFCGLCAIIQMNRELEAHGF